MHLPHIRPGFIFICVDFLIALQKYNFTFSNYQYRHEYILKEKREKRKKISKLNERSCILMHQRIHSIFHAEKCSANDD